MRQLLLLWLAPVLCLAQGRWIEGRSGPFQIYSDAAPRSAKDFLSQLEQFRNALGQVLGKPDLQVDPPIRILLYKSAKELAADDAPGAPVRGRERFMIAAVAEQGFPSAAWRELTRLFLTRNAERIPAGFEKGMEAFFSTIQIQGTHVNWGAAPAGAERNRDWARVALLIASPEYYGKLRVLLFNLQKGIDEEAAYRNALGKSPREFEADVDRYWNAGSFTPSAAPSRALSPDRDLRMDPLAPEELQLARADLLNARSKGLYDQMLAEKVHQTECDEGLALLALRAHNTAEAQSYIRLAVDAGTKNVEILLEYARLETHPSRIREALDRAIQVDPNSAEAHFLLGQKVQDPVLRIAQLQLATKLEPQNSGYWEGLAKEYLAQQKFADAGKAWHSAEQAAANDSDRERYRAERAQIEQNRLDYEEAERNRIAAEKEADINRLKAAALADLHAAEAKANGKPLSVDEAGKAVPWWDGPKPPGHVEGTFKQVDCIGRQLRLALQTADGKMERLLVKDPGQLTIMGPGELTLGCGPQSGRHASIDYYPKPNAKLGTAGEAANIELK